MDRELEGDMTIERKTPWTPGPWRANGDNISSVSIRGADGWAVCACRSKAPTGEITDATRAVGRANARLIAEAPAMAGELSRLHAEFIDARDSRMGDRRSRDQMISDIGALLARIGAPT